LPPATPSALDVAEDAATGVEVEAFGEHGVVGGGEARVTTLDGVAHGEVALPEGRLLERVLERVGQAADRKADAELLAVAAIPAFGIREVEVGFGVFDETDEAFDGAEAGAEADLAGRTFLDRDAQIALSRDGGGHGSHAHFLEELRVAQARLGDAGPGEVEDLAGSERQFAGDDRGTGLRVALDLDGADRVTLAFFDDETDVDRAGREVGLTHDLDGGVDVAHLAVILLELLGSGLDGRDGEGVAGLQLIVLDGVRASAQGRLGHDLAEGFEGEERVGGAETVALDRQGPDGVTASFGDLEDDVEPAGVAADILDDADLLRVGLLDLDVEVTLVAIEFTELTAVFAVLLRIEAARTQEPGPLVPAILAGGETGAVGQLGTTEGLRAVEAIRVDLELDALVDDDGDHLAAGDVAQLGGDAREGALLAQGVLQLDLGAAELGHVEGFAETDVLQLLAAEPGGVGADEPVAADVLDALEDRPGLDGDDDVDLAGLRVEDRLDRGLGEPSGRVEGTDGAGHGLLGEGLAFAQGDEAAHELLGDGRAGGLDADGADLRVLGPEGVLGASGERQQGEGEAGGAEPAAAEGGLIHYCGSL